MSGKLYRSYDSKVIGGVCGGLAEYFDIDPIIVRLVFILLAFAGGHMILVYIQGWIIIPSRKPVAADAKGQPVQDEVETTSSNRGIWFGVILVLMGFGFLLESLGLWYCWSFSRFWPLILIAIGILIMAKAFTKKEVNL